MTKSIIKSIIFLTLFFASALSRGSNSMIFTAQNQSENRMPFMSFKEICEERPISNGYDFLLSNLHNHFDKKAKIDVLEDYSDYRDKVSEHLEVIKKYMEELVKDTERKETDFHLDQFYYIRARLDLGLSNIVKELTEDQQPVVFELADGRTENQPRYEKFLDNVIDSEIADVEYFSNILAYIKKAAKINQNSGAILVKDRLTPIICKNVIDVLVQVFEDYDKNKFEGIKSKDYLVSFFNKFINYDYDGYRCIDSQGNNKPARDALVERFYKIIYHKDYQFSDSPDYGVFFNKISPRNESNDSKLTKVVDYDHGFIKFHTTFDDLNLEKLKMLKDTVYPISTPFLKFLNNYVDEYSKLGLKIPLIDGNRNIKTKVFGTIYRLYVTERSEINDPEHNYGAEDLPSVCKDLYNYVLKTEDFDNKIDNSNLIKKTNIQNFVNVKKFNEYRFAILAILGKMVQELGDNDKNFIQDNKDDILSIVDKLTNFNGLVPVETISNVFGDDVYNAYKQITAKNILKNVIPTAMERIEKYNQIMPEEDPLDVPEEEESIEDPEKVNKEDEMKNNLRTFMDIKNVDEDPVFLEQRTHAFIENLANNDLETVVPIISALDSVFKYNPNTRPQDIPKIHDRMKVVRKPLMEYYEDVFKNMLSNITTPGLYNLFLFLSGSNQLYDTIIMSNPDPELNKERQRLFTFDKTLFLHKWHEIMKERYESAEDKSQFKKIEAILSSSIPNSKMLKNNLSINYRGKELRGYDGVFNNLLEPSVVASYIKNLFFMSKLFDLFAKFYNLSDRNEPLDHKLEKNLLILYKLILDIRVNKFNVTTSEDYTLLFKKIYQIRTTLLEAHINKKISSQFANKYSVTYSEVNKITYFLHYMLSQNNKERIEIFKKDIMGNFGAKKLAMKYSAIINEGGVEHNPFEFGEIAYGSYDFILHIYKYDNEFLEKLCDINELNAETMTGFCAQVLLFSRTVKFLGTEQNGSFTNWVEKTMVGGIKEFVMKNKGIIFAVLEMINLCTDKIDALKVNTSINIHDTEEYQFIFNKNKKNDMSLSEEEESEYFKLMMLGDEDKEWFVNYMYLRFENPYDVNREHIYRAFEELIDKEDMSQLLRGMIKFDYLDSEVIAKAYNRKALRSTLKYVRSHEGLGKIADYLIKENRAHMLVYLTKKKFKLDSILINIENLTNTNDIVDRVKDILLQYTELLDDEMHPDSYGKSDKHSLTDRRYSPMRFADEYADDFIEDDDNKFDIDSEIDDESEETIVTDSKKIRNEQGFIKKQKMNEINALTRPNMGTNYEKVNNKLNVDVNDLFMDEDYDEQDEQTSYQETTENFNGELVRGASEKSFKSEGEGDNSKRILI